MLFNINEKIFRKKNRILSIRSSIGNVGFIGEPLISGLYTDSSIVECYETIYSITSILIGLSVGIYPLILNKKYISIFSAINNQAIFDFLINDIFQKV